MANQNDDNTGSYGSSVQFTGRVVNKRLFTTSSNKQVANLFIRTKTHRGKFFGIPVVVWEDEAQKICAQIDEYAPGVPDGEVIREEDAPIVTIEGELNEDSWEDKQTKQTHRRLNINAYSISIDA
jgi:hypothetical protein